MGVRGHQGVIGAGRDSRYSGARMGIGDIEASRGCKECQGPFWGCQGAPGDIGHVRSVFGVTSGLEA